MKKISILTILSLLLIFVLAPPIYAATAQTILVEEPSANTGGLWHEEDGNRVYIHMRYTRDSYVIETGSVSNFAYPDYNYSLYTFIDAFSEEDFSFPNTLDPSSATITNPNSSLYDKFVVEIVSSMNVVSGSTPEVITVADYSFSIVNEVEIELNNFSDSLYQNYYDYTHMNLIVDGEEILTSRNNMGQMPDADINPYYNALSFGVRMYWETSSIEVIDPGDTTSETTWDSLPTTSGSPVNPIGDWGTVSNLSVSNQSISFDIIYQGITYQVNPFLVDGDLDFINNSNDVLYYTDSETDNRMLYFNFGDTIDSAILTAGSFSEVNEWEGEALWNLTQNEVKVTDVLTVYNYIPEVDLDGNVYSYFYMPDVPIDNLISVSAILAYQYYETNLLGNKVAGDIQYKSVAAVSGEQTTVNPSWVETTYTTAYITGVVAAVATTAGWIPGYGWAITVGAFLVGGVLNVADVNEWFAYDIDQITHVIPSTSLTSEINNYISDTGGYDSYSPDDDKLYKLHLATLNEEDDVQVISELSNVTQVVWETDGEIFVVNEENIDSVDWGGPGTLEPDNIVGDFPDWVIYVGIGVTAVLVFNKFNLSKKPGTLIVIAAGVVWLLHYLGVITWFQ